MYKNSQQDKKVCKNRTSHKLSYNDNTSYSIYEYYENAITDG